MGDVGDWLKSVGLDALEPVFASQDLDFAVLPDITDEDLKELGLSLGHRKKLRRAIDELIEIHDRAASASNDAAVAIEGRRPVAVLFIDLADFTSLAEKLDPEELQRVLGVFLDAMDNTIQSCGGTVDKHLGDGVLAIFGAPVAHGNDVLRAAKAACLAMSSLDKISDSAGHALAAHAGIAVGEVVAGQVGSNATGYTVIGDTVNLASRLDGLAQRGQILMDLAAASALRGQVESEDLGPMELKGFTRLINVWRLRSVLDEALIEQMPPLIGRHAERAQILSVLDACLQDGSGGTILIRGEAGIGKTRLLADVEAAAIAKRFKAHKVLNLNFGVGQGGAAVETLARSLVGVSADYSPELLAQRSAESARSSQLSESQQACLDDLAIPRSPNPRTPRGPPTSATKVRISA